MSTQTNTCIKQFLPCGSHVLLLALVPFALFLYPTHITSILPCIFVSFLSSLLVFFVSCITYFWPCFFIFSSLWGNCYSVVRIVLMHCWELLVWFQFPHVMYWYALWQDTSLKGTYWSAYLCMTVCMFVSWMGECSLSLKVFKGLVWPLFSCILLYLPPNLTLVFLRLCKPIRAL